MVKINLNYLGDLRVEATHGPSQTKLITDAPIDNHGKGESFSPSDLVATALGSCMVTLMGIVAERHQLEFKKIKVEIEKIMSTDTPRRIQKLVCHFKCDSPLSKEQSKMLERAAMTCPVKESLNPNIELDIRFEWQYI